MIGIAIANSLGLNKPSGTSIDPAAAAFITSAGITNPTQQAAINNLVVSLKANNLWTKMKAIYPFVGGTATTHKYNLKDPRDLDAAFRLVFNGGWTHDSNGATPNGTNGYADTKLNDSSLTPNSSHISYYSRINTGSTSYDMGIYNGTKGIWFTIGLNGAFAAGIFQTGVSGEVNYINLNTTGYYLAGKNGNTTVKLFKNGTSVASGAKTDTTATNTSIYLASLNQNGIPAYGFSNKQTAFATIGDGLSDTEAANLYTAVQAFQTSLGRYVGVPIVSDANAQAFLDAAQITNQTQANAINTLVQGLKTDGLWSKMKAIYPFVGGTATTHKYNLKDPRDLDAAFRLVFNGGWTHDSNGATPNGTNGYADTKFNNAVGQLNSAHLSVYNRLNLNTGTAMIGANDGNGRHYLGQGNTFAAINSSAEGNYNPSSYAGFHMIKRENSTETKQLYNGSVITTSAISSTGKTAINFYIAARNSNGSSLNYNNNQYAFTSIGDGLTDTEAANLYTRVQNYQIALSRNV